MHQPLTQSICATATLLLMSMPLTDNTWRGAAIRMCLLTQWASREVTEENLSVWKAGHQECRLTSPLSNDPALQLWSAATSQYTACYHSTQYLRYRQYIIHWNMTQYAHSSRSTVNWQWHSTSSNDIDTVQSNIFYLTCQGNSLNAAVRQKWKYYLQFANKWILSQHVKIS